MDRQTSQQANQQYNRRPDAGNRRRAQDPDKIGIIRFRGKSVPHFFQGDEPWGTKLLNHDDTVASAGCAVSSGASILNYYGRNVTPADVDAHLDRNNGYLQGSDGIANWDIALATGETPDVIIQLERSIRTYSGDSEEEMYQLVEESLRKNIPVIGRIKYGNSSQDYNHFLVIAGKSKKGHHLLVDPGLRNGDGPSDPKQPDVVLETATRNGGLKLVGIQLLRVSIN